MAYLLSLFQKIIGIDTCLFEYCSKGTFGNVARMIGKSCIAICLLVIPDFMASGCLPIKAKTERLETLYDLSVLKTS